MVIKMIKQNFIYLMVIGIILFSLGVNAYSYDYSDFQFNGSQIKKVSDINLKGLQSFSLDTNVKINKATHGYIVFKENNFLLQTGGSPCIFQFGFWIKGYWKPLIDSKTKVYSNKTYNVSVIYDNKTNIVNLFINGLLEGTAKINQSIDTSSTNLYFGNRPLMDRGFVGIIRYVNISIPQKPKIELVSKNFTCNNQTFNYDDVLLVTNTRSQDSKDLSNYFIQKRGITHQILIDVTTSESVSYSDYYNKIRKHIEKYLNDSNLQAKINYIVLTKGIPIKTYSNCTKWENCIRSVDSLLTGIYTNRENDYYSTINNMYYSVENFSSVKEQFDLYMITRIDGKTLQDAKQLVTQDVCNDIKQGRAFFDNNPLKTGKSSYYALTMFKASEMLKNRGYNVIYDNTTKFYINIDKLFSYYSWGSNDNSIGSCNYLANSSLWNLSFIPGSLADTAVSTSGRTLVGNWTNCQQSLISDLIHMKVSGVKGYVAEPYVTSISSSEEVLNKYTKGYNLASSFYYGSIYISWMDLVIGDPKITVNISKGE